MYSDKNIVIPGRAAVRREGKGIHFVETERFLRRMGALPSRFALAGHDNSPLLSVFAPVRGQDGAVKVWSSVAEQAP